MKIILIGMRAAGKTSLVRGLSERINIKCMDIDSIIEQNINNTIQKFVQENGWEEFRREESKALEESLNRKENSIIACGGGIIESETNRNFLQKQPIVIHITRDINEIIQSIQKSNRPSLTDLSLDEEVTTIFNKRLPFYKQCSQYSFHYSNIGKSREENISLFHQYLKEILEENNLTL